MPGATRRRSSHRIGRRTGGPALGVQRAIAKMQAPARAGLEEIASGAFFAAEVGAELGRRSDLRCGCGAFLTMLEGEFGSRALEPLDHRELGLERLLLLGISRLDRGAAAGETVFG